MKILVATQQIGRRWSGLGTYATNLVEGLRRRGIDVTVMCPAVMADEAGDKIVPIEIGGWTKAVNYWLPLAYAFGRKLKEIQSRDRYDLIHFTDAREALFTPHGRPTIGTMNDYYAAAGTANPLYIMRHYSDWPLRYPYYQMMRAVEPLALIRLNGIIANTNFVRDIIAREYHIQETRFEVVNYGVQLDVPKEYEHLDGSPSVLFVGANFQRKGLPDLVRATALLKRKYNGIVVHVVGEDGKVRVIERLANDLGIAESLRFHGLVPNERVRRLKADMFVMPSLVEGFGIVFLEAMANRMPVIGGAVGGTVELIRDGVNGFVVAPGDVEELARKMERIYADQNMRNKLVEAGAHTVKEYTIDRMVEKTINYYEKIIATL